MANAAKYEKKKMSNNEKWRENIENENMVKMKTSK
jgi:hypothetical protein